MSLCKEEKGESTVKRTVKLSKELRSARFRVRCRFVISRNEEGDEALLWGVAKPRKSKDNHFQIYYQKGNDTPQALTVCPLDIRIRAYDEGWLHKMVEGIERLRQDAIDEKKKRMDAARNGDTPTISAGPVVTYIERAGPSA